MCGRAEMQDSLPLHLSFVHHQAITHKNSIPASPAIAGSGLLIYSPRRCPARASCDAVGLAIVAAIQAELDASSVKPTSLGSGMINSIAAAAAGRRPLLSPTPSAPAPPHNNISRPMPIRSFAQPRQIKSLLPSLDSCAVNSKESKLSAHNYSNARRINHKSSHTNQRINNNVDDIRAREPIFSTALSPPCITFSSNLTPSPDFLGACFFCKRPLGPGKDIYMYRGDRAFCTTECRYQQIVVDERKERCLLSTARKGNQASAIKKPSHRLPVEATIAVFG